MVYWVALLPSQHPYPAPLFRDQRFCVLATASSDSAYWNLVQFSAKRHKTKRIYHHSELLHILKDMPTTSNYCMTMSSRGCHPRVSSRGCIIWHCHHMTVIRHWHCHLRLITVSSYGYYIAMLAFSFFLYGKNRNPDCEARRSAPGCVCTANI